MDYLRSPFAPPLCGDTALKDLVHFQSQRVQIRGWRGMVGRLRMRIGVLWLIDAAFRGGPVNGR
jgi:hypothetical protein